MPLFRRRRESSQPLKSLDTRFRGYDEFTGLANVLGYFLPVQDVRFPSFRRRRESSQPLKSLDTRFRGYDEFTGLAKVLRLIRPIIVGNLFNREGARFRECRQR